MAPESRENTQTGQTGQTSQTGSFSHATSAVNTAGSIAHGAVDKAAGAADQVLAKVKSTTDNIRESAHGAVDKAVGATTPAARWIEEREIYAKEKEEALVKATSEWVLAHPVKSLGIAFVAGLVVGRITS